MRRNDTNKTTHHRCYMRNSYNFDKIDSYLKSVLNILILRNLIAGWREGVIKEGAGILHEI